MGWVVVILKTSMFCGFITAWTLNVGEQVQQHNIPFNFVLNLRFNKAYNKGLTAELNMTNVRVMTLVAALKLLKLK